MIISGPNYIILSVNGEHYFISPSFTHTCLNHFASRHCTRELISFSLSLSLQRRRARLGTIMSSPSKRREMDLMKLLTL